MNNTVTPPEFGERLDEEEGLMTWVGHLSELRSRLLKTFVFFMLSFAIAYPFGNIVLEFLSVPLAKSMQAVGGSGRMIFTGVAEGFVTHLKMAGFGACLFTFPFALFQLWRFVSPGLYDSEKRFIRPMFFAAPVLFLCGGAFVFYVVMPAAFRFLLGFQQLTASEGALPVVLEARLQEYLSFLIAMFLAFGISFQLPLILIVLAKLGVFTAQSLKEFRRYAIVLIFILAAVATPPDVISQFALALPLLILYEGAIWVIERVEKKTN